MAEHTQLPWYAANGGYLMAPDGNHAVQVGKIGSFHDKEIAPFNKGRWQADLELIVKAVNAHDALVKALQKVRAYNVDIADGRINYRPMDHIEVIDEALSHLVGRMSND